MEKSQQVPFPSAQANLSALSLHYLNAERHAGSYEYPFSEVLGTRFISSIKYFGHLAEMNRKTSDISKLIREL